MAHGTAGLLLSLPFEETFGSTLVYERMTKLPEISWKAFGSEDASPTGRAKTGPVFIDFETYPDRSIDPDLCNLIAIDFERLEKRVLMHMASTTNFEGTTTLDAILGTIRDEDVSLPPESTMGAYFDMPWFYKTVIPKHLSFINCV